MVKNPKVSICIPIYNVEKYIERCTRSLLNQSYKNIEYIFVDDCSPDNSIGILENIIKNHPDRANNIKLIRNQKNQGLAQSRINAIEYSTGDYIFHVDSDDWIAENAIELLVNKAIQENADIVFGNSYRAYLSGKQFYELYYNADKFEFIRSLLERRPGVAPVVWNRLIRRELHLKAMPVSGINYSEDWVTFPRIAYFANKICKINSPTYYYYQANINSYSNTFSDKSKNNLIQASNILIDFFKDKNGGIFNESIEILKRRIIIFFYSTGNRSYINEVRSLYPNTSIYHDLSLKDLAYCALVSVNLYLLIPLLNKIGVSSKSVIRKVSALLKK